MNPNFLSPPSSYLLANRAWPTQPRELSIRDITTPIEPSASIPISTGNRSPQYMSSPVNTPLAPIAYPGAVTTPPTVFESMLMGTVPCKALYSDDICGAVVDANAQAPFHILIFPKDKNNLDRLSAITEENEQIAAAIIGHMIVVAQKLLKQYGFVSSGSRIVINDGKNGGQSVEHLVVHVLAGRKFNWPPG